MAWATSPFSARICALHISPCSDLGSRAEKGEVAQAISDLQAMVFRNGRNYHLHYVLGTLYSKKTDPEKAAQEFRKAYELLDRQMQHAEE